MFSPLGEEFRQLKKELPHQDYTLPSGRIVSLVQGYEWFCLDALLGRRCVPVYHGPSYSEEEITFDPPLIKYRYIGEAPEDRTHLADMIVYRKGSTRGQVRPLVVNVGELSVFNQEHNHAEYQALAAEQECQIWIFHGPTCVAVITYHLSGQAFFSDGREYHGGKLHVKI